jgi:hypothetical protein
MDKSGNATELIKIAGEYFDYMARNYPVMCSCDEFYFFPRAKESTRFLNHLDSLDQQKIKQDTNFIKSLKTRIDRLASKNMGLESQIDLTLLNQSTSTLLREFDIIKIWQRDPSLYLKIILFGIYQILERFSFLKQDIGYNLRARIAQIPRVVDEATRNLTKIPLPYLEVASQMIETSIHCLKNLITLREKLSLPKDIGNLIKRVLESLADFKRFLIKRPIQRGLIEDRQILESILRDSFSYKRSLKEIFEIAYKDYQDTLKRLEGIAQDISPGKTWQEILASYQPDIKDLKGLLNLYSTQIDKIRIFLKQKDVITIPPTQQILVRPTPEFMKPIRASASYSSPITDDRREPAYFYLTADFTKPKTKPLFSNIHNEYIFVTAHETYPGHHLLDSVRRKLKNPIRQQIESPLFYEGWASYGERLIDEWGYIKDPLQRLVGLRRGAWRAVRAMLDVGIRINKLKVEDAGGLLKGLGYEAETVKLMLRHYQLMPGYQLCYTIGKFEIDRLKSKFISTLGLKRFHDALLEGGQIPFELIEKRLKKICPKNS